MNQFILLVFVVGFLYVEQYDKIYRLNSELETRTLQLHNKNAQLEAQTLECDLYRQSLEAEVDQLYRNFSEMRQLIKQQIEYIQRTSGEGEKGVTEKPGKRSPRTIHS